MKSKKVARLLATLMAFSLLGAACGGGSDNANDTGTQAAESPAEEGMPEEHDMDSPEPTEGAVTVDTPASNLTRDLTYLLDGHEYHAGLAVLTAVQAGGDLKDPTFVAAAGALDDNAKALGAALGSVYGPEAEKQFLSLWRAHIGFFVDYTLGKATGDDKMVATAKKKLNGYRADFGAFIEGATEGGLTQEQVAEALTPHVQATFAAIDSVVAGDGQAFAKLQEASNHMPMIATALSGAIAGQQELEGNADDGAAQLQRDMTHLLTGHEYHAGLAVLTAVQAGGDLKDPTFVAAAAALDDNTKALGAAIGSLYGKPAEKQFLSLWRTHIGFFVDYTLGKATGDDKMVSEAKTKLDGYRADFGALIEGATEGGLTQDQVAEALKPHVDATFAAIDSVVAGKADAFDKLQTAADHMPMIATALSSAFVAQFPEKFES